MNCFETADTIYHFIDTVKSGDALVMYPLHIPRPEVASSWGTLNNTHVWCAESAVLRDDEPYIFSGNAPLFMEVNAVGQWEENNVCKHRTMYSKPIAISNRLSVTLDMTFRYLFETDEWKYSIISSYYKNSNDMRSVMFTRMTFNESSIGMLRRTPLCENILAASMHRIKRDVMREVFSKKMGDKRAVEMIAYSFFPLL